MKILPTHTCFDDALDFMAERLKQDKKLAFGAELLVVHGVCLAPEGRHKDRPFAHAWVEEGGRAWQGGILDGEKVFYSMTVEEFCERLRPQHWTKYTVSQAARENHRTNHFGPWVQRYADLCNDSEAPTAFVPEEELQ